MPNHFNFPLVVSSTMINGSFPVSELHHLVYEHIATHRVVKNWDLAIKTVVIGVIAYFAFSVSIFTVNGFIFFLALAFLAAFAFRCCDSLVRPKIHFWAAQRCASRIADATPRKLGWSVNSNPNGHYFHQHMTLIANWLIAHGYYEKDKITLLIGFWQDDINAMEKEQIRHKSQNSILEVTPVVAMLGAFGVMPHLFIDEYSRLIIFSITVILVILINIKKRAFTDVDWFLMEMRYVRQMLQVLLFRFDEHADRMAGVHCDWPRSDGA